MVVTVSYENSQHYHSKRLNYDETVSSAPIGRRSSGLGQAAPMEEGGGPPEGKKKWSIGKLFRRKKKDSESEASSSSDDNSQKISSKKKKTKKRSSTPRTSYDRVVNVQNGQRSQSVTKFPQKEYFDEGVLSDPSAGFVGYVGRGLPRSPLDQSRFRSKESLDKRGPGSSCGSQDGSLRKGRKGRIKARVEAMRNVKNESSSDDESQKSTTSSILKFRSDDSLANHSKEGSVSKRSRSARNDRYIKRLSRDDETQLNKEADLIEKGFSRSEAELFALKHRVLSTPQMNGNYGKTSDEPDYSEPLKPMQNMPYDPRRSYSGTQIPTYQNLANGQVKDRMNRRQPTLSTSNSSVYSYPTGVINFNAQVNDENITYSVPYNVNKQLRSDVQQTRPNFRRNISMENNNEAFTVPNYENDVMVVKLPLGVPKKETAAPPPPPPRDPQRKVPTPVSYMYDNNRPVSYAFEPGSQRNMQRPAYSVNNPNINTMHQNNIYENSAPLIKQTGWSKRPISTSEDHIAMQQSYYNAPLINRVNQPKRPASITAEVIRPELYNRYLNRPQINNNNLVRDPQRRHTQENTNPDFLYFADKTPRSRRPIHIAQSPGEKAQHSSNHANTPVQPKNASDFWRKLDSQESQRRRHFGHNRTLSDQSLAGNQNVQNLPRSVQNSLIKQNVTVQPRLVNGSGVSYSTNYSKINAGPLKTGVLNKRGNKENEPICYSNIDIIPMDDIRNKSKNSDDDPASIRRKSTNLEDALSELEAIYNSLGLGDEDLLERAERQEMLAPKTAESLPYGSNENYFRFPSISDYPDGVTRRLSLTDKKSVTPDKVHDDMAYRRLNPKERPKSKDANSLVSQVSYMMASPVLATDSSASIKKAEVDEPDVVFDDVVFRNIRQANNYLKIEDPQPPFGIPIGPIAPAPNSDYLHAIPEGKIRSRFIPQESPDIVSDDLAFRSLRKDSKNPSPINKENPGCIFNNTSENSNLSQPSKIFDNHVIKKKRAVRSLSANIFTLVQREIDDALDMYNIRSLERAQSIPDLPEAVVEFGKSGKIPENFKSSQQMLQESPKQNVNVMNNSVVSRNGHINQLSNRVKLDKPSENASDANKVNYKSNSEMKKELKNKFLADSFNTFNDSEPSIQRPNFDYLNPTPKKITIEFQDELDTMAEEAKETSAKLVIALEELQKEKLIKANENRLLLSATKQANDSNKISKQNVEGSNTKENNIVDIKAHILHSAPVVKVKGTIPAHIKEKMEEFAKPKKRDDSSSDEAINLTKSKLKNDNKDNNKELSNISHHSVKSAGENTEDSLIAISNQLRIVGCTLKSNSENRPDVFSEEGAKLKFLANQCNINISNSNLQLESKIQDCSNLSKSLESVKTKEKISEISKPTESKSLQANKRSSPPTTSTKCNIDTINNMQSFDDLRKGISELLDGIGSVSDKLHLPKVQQKETVQKVRKREETVGVDSSAESDIDKTKGSRDSPEYNSSEELAMIFNLDEKTSKASVSHKGQKKAPVVKDSHEELNSPRLVNDANQTLRKLSLEENDTSLGEASKPPVDNSAEVSTSNAIPWRRRQQSSSDSANKGTSEDLGSSKRRSWYRDPNTLMLACSYSLICSQQLAGLDFLTLLGILLAMISIIAMMII